jgi:hypothetical protein
MPEVELITEEKTCLAAGNDFEQTGVSQSEANAICRANPDAVMGYTFQIDNPDYCHIKIPGTTKFPLDDWSTVIVNELPEIELKPEENACLAAGNDFEQTGVGEAEAQEICRANPGKVMGYTFHVDNPEYCHIKKPGTCKFPCDGWTTVIAYTNICNLPTENLFGDCYVDGWGEDICKRPGRGEGLLDDKQICLFKEIHPCDLHQGSVGDCWLISAISALAEFPGLVRKIFNTKTLAPKGSYLLNLYDFEAKSMVTVRVDDRLPCNGGGGIKYVQASPDGEIWPCILEKAMAAINGGYEHLNGYWAVYGLAQMTGCLSTKTYFHEKDGDAWHVSAPTWSGNLSGDKSTIMDWHPSGDIDTATMWETLCDFDSKKYVMCCDSFGTSDATLDDAGVVGCHAYSLVQVKSDVAGSGKHLLQIRNPWSTQEASLPWSDGDDMWQQYPDVAAELQPENEDDGMFWIQWEDFIKHYRGIFVLEISASRRCTIARKRGRRGTTKA